MAVYIRGMTCKPLSCMDCCLKQNGYCLLQGRNKGYRTQQEQYRGCPLTEDDARANMEEISRVKDKELRSMMEAIHSHCKDGDYLYAGKRDVDGNKIYVSVDEDVQDLYLVTDDYREIWHQEKGLEAVARYVLELIG